MYYLYILHSVKDEEIYTGFSDNLKRRLQEHNKGLVEATKYRRPLKLIYYEACLSKKDALHRETYLKSSWGKRFVKNRLKNYLKEGEGKL